MVVVVVGRGRKILLNEPAQPLHYMPRLQCLVIPIAIGGFMVNAEFYLLRGRDP